MSTQSETELLTIEKDNSVRIGRVERAVSELSLGVASLQADSKNISQAIDELAARTN